MTLQLLVGFGLGGLISLLAWRMGVLSPAGAAAAAVTGGIIFGLGGLAWAVLLIAFFASSSFLSRAFGGRKASVEREFAKGSRRDAGQVLANGGIGTLLVLIQAVFPGQIWIWVAFAGAMAAVNADTWATELGVLSKSPPRLVTTGRVVPKGSSGAVTVLGTLASLAGAVLVATLAAILTGWLNPAGFVLGIEAAADLPPFVGWNIFLGVSLGGLAGSLVDSLLGATLQSIYYCPTCAKETERHPQHTCGSQTQPWRGWIWLDNDWVNLVCSAAGALVAMGFFWLLGM